MAVRRMYRMYGQVFAPRQLLDFVSSITAPALFYLRASCPNESFSVSVPDSTLPIPSVESYHLPCKRPALLNKLCTGCTVYRKEPGKAVRIHPCNDAIPALPPSMVVVCHKEPWMAVRRMHRMYGISQRTTDGGVRLSK